MEEIDRKADEQMRKSFQRAGKKNIWTKKEVSDAKPSRAPAKKRKRKEEESEGEDRDIELVPEPTSRNMMDENGEVPVPVNPGNPPAPSENLIIHSPGSLSMETGCLVKPKEFGIIH